MQHERTLPLSEMEAIMFHMQDLRIEIMNALDFPAERWNLFRAFCSGKNYPIWRNTCRTCFKNEPIHVRSPYSCPLCMRVACPGCMSSKRFDLILLSTACKRCSRLHECITYIPDDKEMARNMLRDLYISSVTFITAASDEERHIYMPGIDIEKYEAYVKSIAPKTKKIKIERKE